MSTAVPHDITGTRFTPEDLLRLPDAVSYELVDGKLVERHMGMESSRVALRLAVIIAAYLKTRPIGLLFGADASYQCFPDAPEQVRKPDLSFVQNERLGPSLPEGHCRIAPDLAVEVISPNEIAYDVEEKVAEYLDAGIPLVWVLNPPTRTVRVYRSPASSLGSGVVLTERDTLSGEDVLPDFSCPVREIFER